MYIGFSYDQNEWKKIRNQEKWNENYYENIKLTNFDKGTRYFLATIYIIALISLGCYSVQNSLPVLANYYRKL